MPHTPGDRLRIARLKAGYKSAASFARAVGVKEVTYRAHEAGEREMDRPTAILYAGKAKVTPAWLLFGEGGDVLPDAPDDTVEDLAARLRTKAGQMPDGPTRRAMVGQLAYFDRIVSLGHAMTEPDLVAARALPLDVHFVMVRGEVEAGAWREAVEWPEGEWFPVAAAGVSEYMHFPQAALVVRGPSMNLVYPEGSIVVYVPLPMLGRQPRSGERVIVESRRGGLVEATVKEYVVENGTARLCPRSDHPRFQEPLEIPASGQSDLDEVRVTGLVIASVRPEPVRR